jgi:periplasmic divalent cation tolerance protein
VTVEIIEVHTTTDSQEVAQKIAEDLVSQRLAACVQVAGPITSTYWWDGEVSQTEEWVCTAKTRKDLYEKVEQAIKQAHTYDMPEILAVDVVTGSQNYLTWVRKETQPE